MKKILIIWALLISVCFAQSKAGFYVVGGKIITVQDTSSQKYLKAIEDAGVVPSVLQNFASNYLVTTEKAIGSYSLIKAQYPFLGGTSATHKFNLNNPINTDASNRLTFTGSGTHGFLGYQGNGSNAYADTYLTPNVSLGLNSSGLIYYNNNASVNNNVLVGTNNNGAPFAQLALSYDPANIGTNNGNSGVAKTITNKKGLRVINRENSSNFYHYINEEKLPVTSTSVTQSSNKIFINAISVISNSPSFFGTGTASFVAITNGMTEQQVIKMNQIVEFSQNILNRGYKRPLLATYFGDSITQGYNGTTVIANKWTTLLSGYRGLTENNKGISGTTMQNTAPTDLYGTSMRNRLSEILTPTSNDAYLFIAYGVNDCRVSTNYTASIYGTQLGEVIDDAISKGWKLSQIKILTPYLITDYGVGNSTKLLDIRTQALSVSSTKGVQCIDVYSAMSVGDLSADNIHPSTAGYLTIANYINSVLN